MKEQKLKKVKIECHCPCHKNKGVKHVRPCCNGGYREIYVPIEDKNEENGKDRSDL